ADFGQCAISNQPSFHLPWIYSAIGKREKTEYWVKKLADEAFSCTADGFPGDEDNGTTACWYLFACLGFYPLCPGKAEYVASAPLFEKITVCGREIGRFEENLIPHADVSGGKS
ncbi:MAG: glycoside hydrolase domain-containing protein, partial [Candidatus Gallimonas sp.]